jgi:hypothetical protein
MRIAGLAVTNSATGGYLIATAAEQRPAPEPKFRNPFHM